MTTRKCIITIEDHGEHTTTQMEGSGFSPFEIVGYLEQCKAGLLEDANKKSKMAKSMHDLLGRMRPGGPGGFNIEDLLGGLPGISGPRDDEDK